MLVLFLCYILDMDEVLGIYFYIAFICYFILICIFYLSFIYIFKLLVPEKNEKRVGRTTWLYSVM